jgi:hypothetical protein
VLTVWAEGGVAGNAAIAVSVVVMEAGAVRLVLSKELRSPEYLGRMLLVIGLATFFWTAAAQMLVKGRQRMTTEVMVPFMYVNWPS